MSCWELVAMKSPSPWKQTIKLALGSHVRQLQRDALARSAEAHILSILESAGAPPAWDDPRHRLRAQDQADAKIHC
eukprot:3534554-Pyramimonas_sp.AAC.1